MTYTQTKIQDFLAGLAPFAVLKEHELNQLADKCQFLRYRMGQTVLRKEQLPTQILIVYSGQIRLLGYDPTTQLPITLSRLEQGEILGWAGIIRNKACETAIASTDAVCITIEKKDFLTLVNSNTQLEALFYYGTPLIEIFELLSQALKDRHDKDALLKAGESKDIRELALKLAPNAVIRNLSPGKVDASELDRNRSWLVSSGNIVGYPVGTYIDSFTLSPGATLQVEGPETTRLVGITRLEVPELTGDLSTGFGFGQTTAFSPTALGIPYAPDDPPIPEPTSFTGSSGRKYPFFKGRGPLEATTACFRMLSKYFQVPFRKDVIGRVLKNQVQNAGNISLQACGAVAELQGLNAQLIKLPTSAIARVQTPALIAWQDSFAILYEVNDKQLTIAIPETGIRKMKPSVFLDTWGQSGEVLLLQRSQDAGREKFGLSWFIPALKKYKRVLIEVLIASFFVQLFGLANPLMTQFIIDKVVMNKSIDTLHVFGTFLIVMAVVEAILTALRTNLFVDTTNRIDLSLGSQIIDHLFRLPLKYFEKRPVGELATRINELENIRQFLTGTALTVVLDAIFSIIYIIVMLIYSPLLTVVALATLPAFAVLTWIVSPIVRQQLRTKAERNAEAQSYLVEVVGGIQTVKAQNIELRSRWQWQSRYAKYVSAGFKTVSTNTTAGAISGFLNKLSSLLLLWVGAWLVLKGDLTLGQLIAFRIIAGYTTSPLLRLVQIWQNFQETALSLERLSDIIDSSPEVDEDNINNIPLPAIRGKVKYENISFSFPGSSGLQLNNVNLEFKAGDFVAIVGLSGSGKSTLMKLLPRLYEPNQGRILVDNYDINKVELYSLRRQIGYVLQDTLLFNGTVRENICLTNPDAADEEIIKAAQIAAAHDFIMTLPNGYNTKVGERGSALSGGQRQRIAIARTVLQKPQMLILDEATSALDYDSERQVCLNLSESFKGETVFFITHRLSSIKHADRIVMMDKGVVVEQGTHNELMALQGRYYCLYQQQEFQA